MVRACGSYPQCPGFDSLHRHLLLSVCRIVLLHVENYSKHFQSYGIAWVISHLGALLLALRVISPKCQPCCVFGESSAFQLYMWARRYSPTANNPGARLQKNDPAYAIAL